MGFIPKENAVGIYIKKYQQHENYSLEVNVEKQTIHYGNLITSESKTTQNFSQPENFVVLECVDRLLTKGYPPQQIVLEKTWPAGHGTSGRLDICVRRSDGTDYLLIECKTFGKEFEKESGKLHKDGGQLFTYFKFSNHADVLMLYTSHLDARHEIRYRNEIIKIEEAYRAGDVNDFYEKWNKLTKDNGIFEEWVKPYNFESKALTMDDLKTIQPEDSGFIFNRFLEILRHNVVSDKPNAFNKIFTLFLCKIYDEKECEGSTRELAFQWKEGIDDDTSFQLRLTDLYKEGMWEFLDKHVTDFSEEQFKNRYQNLTDEDKNDLLKEINKIRLEKNNEFAIKEVYDEKSFKENAVVVKQVVELLQGYKIRYAAKQQYLSDFFELLLTTGFKQESGQFFTPVPVAQFIIKSLPVDAILSAKLLEGKKDDLLPYIIDYASGSGHFITESMNEIQCLLQGQVRKGLKTEAVKLIEKSKIDPYGWALQYVYGIDKDYRLVKVGKVGCYLHGDGLANVIHSDGLARFGYPEYKGKLAVKDATFPQENKQFDIVLSNPPYSISAFKNVAREYYGAQDFELYDSLTDNSSEIECLFVERAKQLLKDGGVAGIILPSSMLTNAGIYTKTREILLQYFNLIAITEFGSNTFMATGTNTVVLFLRRRGNYDCINIRKSIQAFLANPSADITIGGIERPAAKYVEHVWNGLHLDDYLTLLKKHPNERVLSHPLYKAYQNRIKTKKESEFFEKTLAIEEEKLTYFILAYPQQTVLIKSGSKEEEKRFLGYEFSARRGSEGIHAIQRGKEIAECTMLFDADSYDNPAKASTYIYKAFKGEPLSDIPEEMKAHVFTMNLVELLTFDRADFEKTLSLAAKKSVKIESRWPLYPLSNLATIEYGDRIVRKSEAGKLYPVYGGGGETFRADKYNREDRYIYSRFGMSPECVRFVKGRFFLNDSGLTLSSKTASLSSNYIDTYLSLNQERIYQCGRGVAQKNIDMEQFLSLSVPVPPKEVQEKIVNEIMEVEKEVARAKEEIEQHASYTEELFQNLKATSVELNKLVSFKNGLNYNRNSVGETINIIGVGDFRDNIVPEWEKINRIQIEGELPDDYLLKKNDLLIVRSNGSSNLVGRILFIDKTFATTSFSGFTIRLRPDTTKVHPKFLCYYLRINAIRKQFATGSSGSNIKSLNQKLISTIPIPLPSLEAQSKIASQLETIELQIAQARKVIDQSTARKAAILKTYL
ncbi:MAG: restriction endonuclease subunit S [Prevotellaceae bacterium]|nr:restriction endonuclease subunit S [Prevotellaceae bacterium]